MDDTNVGFERVASQPFQSPSYCWIIVPRLYKDGASQWTEATNFFLSKVELPANSSMSLYNLFTGESASSERELFLKALMVPNKTVYRCMVFLNNRRQL